MIALVEIWKSVYEYPYSTRYEVSNFGKVRNKETGKLLKQRVNEKTGYTQVMLTFPSTRKNFAVHRLVLNTFKPTTDNLEVNHIDEDRNNNCLDNLEWVTRKQNINYGSHTSRQRDTLILHKPESKSIPVIITRKDGAKVAVTSVRQASQWTQVSRETIKKYMETGLFIGQYKFNRGRKRAGLNELR